MLNRKRTTTVATRLSEKELHIRSLVLAILVAISVVVLLAISLASVADAQAGETVTGRIVILLQADGDMEFGFQPSEGYRILPETNILPSGVEANIWKRSSPVLYRNVDIGRIYAQRLDNGRTEFMFQQIDGERILPSLRVYPHRQSQWSREHIGQWVHTTSITLTVARALGDDDLRQTINRAAQKNAVVARLFRLEKDRVDDLTKHDYNDFGCPLSGERLTTEAGLSLLDCDDWLKAEWWTEYQQYGSAWQWRTKIDPLTGQLVWRSPQSGYLGGHSGWDVRMRTTNNDWFYALTAGVVTKGKEERSSVGLIGIYDGESHTTLYLHSSDLHTFIQNGAIVEPGDCLGREGDIGSKGAYHVHVELKRGWAQSGSGGARWLSGATSRGEDPVNYLYDWVSRTTARQPICTDIANIAPPPIGKVKSGDRISLQGSNDQYLVWMRNGKWYKRLLINPTVLQSYRDDWPNSKHLLVNDEAQFNAIPTSTLVRSYHGNNSQRIYHLTSDPHKNTGTRYWLDVSGSEFNSAGLDWDSVFPVNAIEFETTNYELGPSLDVRYLRYIRWQQGG